MKNFIVIILLLTFITSCGQSNDLENTLYNCLKESYEKLDVDIESELERFEKYLVKNKTLESTSGQSYYNFYETIITQNDIKSTIDEEEFSDIFKLDIRYFFIDTCINDYTNIDSSYLVESKIYRLSLKLDSLRLESDLNPSVVAKTILSILQPKDFENPYYKSNALLTIAFISNIETGLELPYQNLEMDTSKDDLKSLLITLLPDDSIKVDEKPSDFDKIKITLKKFIQENESKHLILLKSDNKTSYKLYSEMMQLINNTYSDLRNEKSNELFSSDFDKLSVDNKSIIKEIYPSHITEK
jgi:biopolymer transport protein ExbD